MDLHLSRSVCQPQADIKITGSKSETNRLLLLQALFPNIIVENSSNSDDSEVMLIALQSNAAAIDIHHAGTAMRFLTAYFAIQEGREVVLTGSFRMKERPIKTLVQALQDLGATISYEEKQGFPPIKINGKNIANHKVSLPANISSQYISALLLVAPKLENGLELTLEGEITSMPYIQMTLGLLHEIGVETSFEGNTIKVSPKSQSPKPQLITVESDWSSASYFYSIVALSEPGTKITLSSYKENSLQGDSIVSTVYKNFGVTTVFQDNKIVLVKEANFHLPSSPFRLNLNNAPDIAQTIAVTCFGLGLACHLTGLHTLKIKETDRLLALKTELEKLGGKVTITDDSLVLEAAKSINPGVIVATYQDHRMAMAFAPLALKVPLGIQNAEVVSKSYPDFWNDLKAIGFRIKD